MGLKDGDGDVIVWLYVRLAGCLAIVFLGN